MNNNVTFGLQTYKSVLRRRLPLIVLCIVGTSFLALSFSLAQTKQYTAGASLLFRDPGFDQRLFGSPVFSTEDPAREAATNIQLVSLQAVADRTADALSGTITGDEVGQKIQVLAAGQSNLASVNATDPDPAFAAKLANAFATSYIGFRRDADRAKIEEAQRLVRQDLAGLDAQERNGSAGRALQVQLSQLRTLEALQTGNAELVQSADVPNSPSSPQTKRNVLLGGFLGLILGIGLALILERFDRRLREADELEASYGVPVLGTLPFSKTLDENSSLDALGPAERESLQLLRTRLRYFNVDRNLGSLTITSATSGEGKSTVAWQLARQSSAAGIKTVLIEADFHQPVLAKRLGLAPLPGLAETVSHQGSLDEALQSFPIQDEAISKSTPESSPAVLDVLVAGAIPPNPLELVESKEFAALLTELQEGYELVIIDTPPPTLISEAIPIMREVKGVIIVARLGKTTRDAASLLREQLQLLEIPALGIVANGVQSKVYSSYYGNSENHRRTLLGRTAMPSKPRSESH